MLQQHAHAAHSPPPALPTQPRQKPPPARDIIYDTYSLAPETCWQPCTRSPAPASSRRRDSGARARSCSISMALRQHRCLARPPALPIPSPRPPAPALLLWQSVCQHPNMSQSEKRGDSPTLVAIAPSGSVAAALIAAATAAVPAKRSARATHAAAAHAAAHASTTTTCS